MVYSKHYKSGCSCYPQEGKEEKKKTEKGGRKETIGNKQKTNNKIVDLSPSISIITLNINSPNIPIKRD